MPVPWRITTDGEKQWLGGDGFWYSTEELAEKAPASPAQPGSPGTTHVPGNATPFPGIYQRRKPKRKINPRRLVVCLVILGVIVGLIAFYSVKSQSPPYKIDELTVKVINNQQVDVEYRVHNLGSSSWQPQCQVSILPVFGGGIGTALQSSSTPIDGGEYGDVGGIVTISNNDAQAVTTADVTINNC